MKNKNLQKRLDTVNNKLRIKTEQGFTHFLIFSSLFFMGVVFALIVTGVK